MNIQEDIESIHAHTVQEELDLITQGYEMEGVQQRFMALNL